MMEYPTERSVLTAVRQVHVGMHLFVNTMGIHFYIVTDCILASILHNLLFFLYFPFVCIYWVKYCCAAA